MSIRVQRTLLLGAAAAALALPAQAATFDGWYLGLEGGANWISDADAAYDLAINSVAQTADTAEASFDTGWAAFATVGYAFSNNWRIEAEAGYRRNKADAQWFVSSTVRLFEADVDEFSLMANVLYDVPLGSRWRLSLGAGAGGDKVEIDARTRLQANPTWDAMPAVDEWRFAAQAIAGLSYAVTPRMELALTYRYLHVSPPSISDIDAITAGITSYETVALDDFAKHSLTLGLRFDLAPDAAPPTPPPAAPPPPPPPPVKQFIVFFGFDRCDITAEADRVLSEAATAAKATGSASVRVVGHTDTSGSNGYNQRLSDCRANAAKANLAGKGIAESSISTSGRGEAELMVQTGDGVKEPQNRRATVDLQ